MRLPRWLKLPLGKFGDPYGQSADRHALIEIDLDRKWTAEQGDDEEPGRSGDSNDSAQAR